MSILATLDTDFISKGYIIRADDNNRLIDRIMELPDYQFFCHSYTLVELNRHKFDSLDWLKDKIRNGEIESYSDERIINEMAQVYFSVTIPQYIYLLKTACEANSQDYFSKHYAELDSFDYANQTQQAFLSVLSRLDTQIGEDNDLGEIKEYILLQWLNIKQSEPVFYFCSDDEGARNGVLAIDDINISCMSIPSSFVRLRMKNILTSDTMQPYLDSANQYYRDYEIKTICIAQPSNHHIHTKILYDDVLRDIHDNRFIELKSGMLQYKPFT